MDSESNKKLLNKSNLKVKETQLDINDAMKIDKMYAPVRIELAKQHDPNIPLMPIKDLEKYISFHFNHDLEANGEQIKKVAVTNSVNTLKRNDINNEFLYKIGFHHGFNYGFDCTTASVIDRAHKQIVETENSNLTNIYKEMKLTKEILNDNNNKVMIEKLSKNIDDLNTNLTNFLLKQKNEKVLPYEENSKKDIKIQKQKLFDTGSKYMKKEPLQNSIIKLFDIKKSLTIEELDSITNSKTKESFLENWKRVKNQ